MILDINRNNIGFLYAQNQHVSLSSVIENIQNHRDGMDMESYYVRLFCGSKDLAA